MFLFFFLTLLGAAVAQNPDLTCILTHCLISATACIADPECLETLTCFSQCEPTDAQCSFTCSMLSNDNEHFDKMLQCMASNGCMPEYPEDGLCLAEDAQALQDITDIQMVEGDWWVLKGQNCGQDGWPGAYDWYPCQHGRFVKLDDGSWINNTTYCAGKNSTCTSPIIVTIPVLELPVPGVVRHNYPEGEAPLLPQIEDWKFVSIPDPDWALVIWCGTNPVLDYNGAFVVSRHRNLSFLPEDVEAELRLAAENFGIDYNAMCVSDNTACPE